MNSIVDELIRETWVLATVIAGLWFGCHLYEIGFLARFGVPLVMADVGFPRILAILLVAGTAAAFGTALMLWRTAPHMTATPFTALSAMLTVGFAGAIALADDPTLALLEEPPGEFGAVKLLLAGSLIVFAGLLFARQQTAARSGNFGAILQPSLIALLLIAAAVGLGWMGGGSKMANRRSFLYLDGHPDHVLVRLYDDRAVFVRRDERTGLFTADYLVRHLGSEPPTTLTSRPSSR